MLCIEVGVFRKCLLNAVPTGLRRKVGHVAVHAAQSNGPPFAAHHLGECSDGRHVPDAERSRRYAGLLRKLSERAGAGRNTEAGIRLVVVACVVLEKDGDAKALGFRQLLHRIREIRHLPRRDDEAVAGRGHAAVARIRSRLDDVAQDEASHLLRLNQAPRGGRQRATTTGAHRVDEHEPGLLFERHARDQVVDAHLDRESPVFVTVDRPTAVGVPELPAIDGQHRARSHLNGRLLHGRAAAPYRRESTG